MWLLLLGQGQADNLAASHQLGAGCVWLLLFRPVWAEQGCHFSDVGDLLVWLLLLSPGWAAQVTAAPRMGVNCL